MSILNDKQSTYHHGDTRNALIAAAVATLQTEGIEALSLRKLAKQIGVSHNAPYMHFKDKEGLLVAVSEEGFRVLAERINTAVETANKAWMERFQAGCWAYVEFIIEHTGHAQVMFRDYDREEHPDIFTQGSATLELLSGVLQEGQQAGLVTKADGGQQAMLVWSMLHGVASILAARKVPPYVVESYTARQITEHLLTALYVGLQAD